MVIIRKARLRDVSGITELWWDLIREHQDLIVRRNHVLKPFMQMKKDATRRTEKFFIRNIRSRNGIVHVAEMDGKLVGYAFSNISKNPPVYRIDETGYISDLYVKRGFRGKRISSMFKDEAMKWFRKKGLKMASLRCNFDNKEARRIYEKWGFRNNFMYMTRKV